MVPARMRSGTRADFARDPDENWNRGLSHRGTRLRPRGVWFKPGGPGRPSSQPGKRPRPRQGNLGLSVSLNTGRQHPLAGATRDVHGAAVGEKVVSGVDHQRARDEAISYSTWAGVANQKENVGSRPDTSGGGPSTDSLSPRQPPWIGFVAEPRLGEALTGAVAKEDAVLLAGPTAYVLTWRGPCTWKKRPHGRPARWICP
jgi:hypothetical protein